MDFGTLLAVALLLAAVIVWIVLGRANTYEKQLDLLSSGDPHATDRLIEQEQRRSPALSREAAAKRVLHEIRRDSQ